MDKKLVLSEEALQEIANRAADTAILNMNQRSLVVAGCDIECIFEYEGMLRNEHQGVISLKHYCMINNINHRVVYAILRDTGLLEYKYEYEKHNNSFHQLTEKGFTALNGLDSQSEPFISTPDGRVFINDKDDRFPVSGRLLKATNCLT